MFDEIPENGFIAGESYNMDWEATVMLNYCCQQAVSMLVILISAKSLSRLYSELWGASSKFGRFIV